MEDALDKDEMCDHYHQCQMRFPLKLWHLLRLDSDAINWGGHGHSILLNLNVLNSYLRSDASIFKTRHLSSFIRQLNLYGFRKVTSHRQDPLCNSANPHMQEYAHNCFVYNRPDLVDTIARRSIHSKHSRHSRHTKPKSGTVVTQRNAHCEDFKFQSDAIARIATKLNKEKSSRHSMLERARSSLRSALADASRRGQHVTLGRNTSPPPSHPCMQYYFTDLSDREEPEELDLELPSRRLPHPLLPSDNVIHVPLPSLTSTEVPALHALDENLNAMDEDPADKMHSVPPQNVVIFDNEGSVISDWGEEAEKFSAGSNSPKESSTIDSKQSSAYNTTEQTNLSLNDTYVTLSLSDNGLYNTTTGEAPSRDRREWEQLLRELGRELDPASPATTQRASDLSQLYLHISRTIDLLNS